ncbi:MAG: flagellar basal-body MS-ring/collar protein FliF [Burkholderiales bacterium]
MDNAVATRNTNLSAENDSVRARLTELPLRTKATFGLGVVCLLAVVLAMALWGNQGDYKVLYANLTDKDGGAIIAQLSQMNIPYRHAEGGTAILVPASKVHDARLKLASAGLPKGTVTGMELMDGARFGQTQFQERLSFQRGLEGELTRSILALSAVQNARVHLAIPNQNGFFREQQKPSASVLLSLHPGRFLDRNQIAGIIHLVSSSVSELSPKAVSIVDQDGALLSGPSDSSNGLDPQQLQYVHQIESTYSRRILDLLEPVVGRDNLRASVTADIDFAQIEATSEEFRPNQGSQTNVAIRSQQTTEQVGTAGSPPSGTPGAASNLPPIPGAASAPTDNKPPSSNNSRREAVTNYEVDKTVRVTRNATGAIRRISAAVVVNHKSVTDVKGKTSVQALSPDELEKLTALVRESVGFNKERGDSVQVINAPFKVEPIKTVDVPFWKQTELLDIIRTAAIPVALTFIGLLIFMGMIRPAVKAALAPPEPGDNLDIVEDDPVDAEEEPINTKALPAPETNESLNRARLLARENPAAVAGIVRNWVKGESGT